MRRGYIVYSLLLGAVLALPVRAQPASPGPTPQQLQDWVRQLDSDQFAERENATEKLISAGASAVRPVLNSIDGASAEATTRGLFVLKELALTGEPAADEAARA